MSDLGPMTNIMYKIKIHYTDGSILIKEFESYTEMINYVYVEGDHILYTERMQK